MEEWYVVFLPAEREQWFTRFLEPGYGHCYLVRWDGFNWIRIRPNLSRCVVEVLPVVEKDEWDKVLLGDTAVHLEIPVDQDYVRVPWMLTVASCTEACKAILGIRALHVLTPYQLFKYLTGDKHGRRRRRCNERAETTAETPVARIRQREEAGSS